MTIRLTVLGGSLKGQAFLLEGESVTVGRGPGVDLEIQDPSISKVHARIEVNDGQIRVLDLGSRNGIRAGGKAVNKVRFTNGSVTIGRVPVRLEFEGSVAQVPAVADIPRATGTPGQTSAADETGSRMAQVISLAALLLSLAGILLWGFRDVFWPTPTIENIMVKVPENVDSYLISLPAPYAGDPQKRKSTACYDIEVAEGTLMALVVYPVNIGNVPLTVALTDGRSITYDIHVIEVIDPEDPDPIPRQTLSSEERAAMASSLAERFNEAMAAAGSLDGDIAAWQTCLLIEEQNRFNRLGLRFLHEVRRARSSLNARLNIERDRLFLDARNDATLYEKGHLPQDLDRALAKMARVMGFTDTSFPEYERYRNFESNLKELKRNARR